MTGWTRLERRWLAALCAALVPADAAGRLPGLAAVDTARFWTACARAAPPLLRFGLRASVWVLTLWPLVALGRPALLHRLSPARRDLVLARAAASRSWLVRQMVATVKLLACFAYFADPGVRARLEPGGAP
jgi:hypothetical protein